MSVLCMSVCLYVHTWGVIALLAWSRDMHIQDLSTGPGWSASVLQPKRLSSAQAHAVPVSSSHDAMCTPLPCAPARLPVDAILLSGKPLPSFSFVSAVSCRGRHLNGCSSAIKRCALACLAFESHGWLSVAQENRQHARFWSRQALGPAAVCPDRCAYVRIEMEMEIEGGWPAHTATA